ncbi:transaldolase [Intrasporangium sp. YIM S08009]|uniref:transaldolase n=1 Tax=Intrasporangium zincisolvens TaxID=3080018 RepID=UPI002B061DB7|nr:transaldolase [Intrasporangium sp. YIM S08009]
MTNPNTQALSDAGVSIWLDDLSRELLETGRISELITERNVVGVTSNPSIFQAALSKGERYNEDLAALTNAGKDVDEVVHELTTSDVRSACDLFLPLYESSKGVDGRVSIEVDPRLAHDTDKTVEQAKQLYGDVDRPNVLIKIPATKAGLPAITAGIAEGISVNVTLIFSLERYRAVMNAYLEGLEKAQANGHDLSTLHSVASFFVSRVDTEIDKRLDAIGTDTARGLRGKAGLANARLAYQAFEEVFSTPRWGTLADAGANVQRPLWASTGVKDPAYPDTMYVDQLVAADVVNTMPGKTLEATADHADIHGDTVTGAYEEASDVLDQLDGVGVSYTEVVDLLEEEGVDKFEKSWGELLDGVRAEMDKVRA